MIHIREWLVVVQFYYLDNLADRDSCGRIKFNITIVFIANFLHNIIMDNIKFGNTKKLQKSIWMLIWFD